MTDNNTFCSAFWKHTNIRSDNRIYPCCRFKYPVAKFDGDVDKILHLPEYEELRRKSLAGEKIPGCAKCYMEENIGKKVEPNFIKAGASTRKEFNRIYKADEVKLEYLEVGFDNICNLMCVMCSGEWSNRWANFENPDVTPKLNIKDTDEFVNIPDTITHVEFLGGEPLMTNRHITFLEKIKEPTDVTIVYNTNATFMLSDDLINLLSKFKDVFFYVSIDAYGELNDKVREGSNWSDIEKFITQLQELSFNFQIHSVIHTENYHKLNELEDWVHNNGYNWRAMACTYPTKLDIVSLQENEKNKLIEYFKTSKIPNSNYFIEHLTSDNK